MYSFEGIGQWAATFACAEAEEEAAKVTEGAVVKMAANGTVGLCAGGEAFCGMVPSAGRDGGACTVALGGMVTAGYTGAAPALGWSGLSADGSGGVKADAAGRARLVVDVDTDGQTVTFVL